MNTLRGPRAGFASPTLGANAYKRLGIRTTDISRNLFVTTTVPSGGSYSGGKIVRSEFFGFWGQLAISESGDAKQFFETLLEQIREIDIRQQAAGNTGAPMSVNGIPQSAIYNTIAFMLCNNTVRLDVDKLILAYSAYSDPARDPLRSSDSSSIKNIMRLVAIRTQADQSDEHVLSPLVLSILTIIPKDTRYLDWIRQPTVDEHEIQSNEHGFLYGYLMSLVQERGHEILQLILKSIYDKAHSLPQQAKMSMPNAEQTFLAIIHLTKQLLQTNSHYNGDFLDSGIKIFRQFTLWHQPFGKLAENLVLLFKQEILNPGYSRRQYINHESLVVDYGTSSNQPAGSPALTSLYRHLKPVFYLHDSFDLTSLPLLNIIDPSSLQAQHLIRPQVTMVDPSAGQSPPPAIITQMFINAFESIGSLKFTADEVTAIQNIPHEKIIPFTKRLRDLEDKAINQVEQGIFSLTERNNDYQGFKNDLLTIARKCPGPAMFSVPFSSEGPQQVAQLPCLEHIRVPVELKSKSGEHEGTQQPGYPAAAMYDRLQQILQAYAQDPSLKFDGAPDSPKCREVRFVLVGNDRLLQHVVTAYYLLQSNSPNIFHGLDVKFYLAPCNKNLLSNYIAKNDLWYYRHIFCPFRSQFPFIVPWLRDDETELRTNNESGLLGYPTSYFREVISQYVREAHHTFRTVVFKLEGRTEIGGSEPSDVIPFIQRVEVGLTPAIEEFKVKLGSAGSSMKAEDVLKDKTFLYTPVELGIKYLKIDLSNQPKPEVIDDPIPYQSVSLSHVPRRGDLGSVPDPSSKGVELYVTPAPKLDKAKLRKNSLFFDPRQHLAEITCTSQVPFKVLADGVLHGPYRSIRISLAQNKSDGKIAQFPVQTYFPIISP